MAQSGALGFGPPWVGHVGGAAASPPPRVLPRPAPPPRPTRATAGEAVGGRSNPNPGEQVASEAAPQVCGFGGGGGGVVKGYECPPPWDSPSSTASSSYFSYSSTSPPPSAGTPPPPCNPPTPQHRVADGRSKNSAGNNPFLSQNHNPSAPPEPTKPVPAPRATVKVERCEREEAVGAVPENLRCDAGASEEENLSTPKSERYSEREEGEKVHAKFFRRPSEGTGTSVIRRRATVEVRSVAVQTPSGLMSNAFDSRATYPRAKGQTHHWRASNQSGAAVTKSMDGEDGQSSSPALSSNRKTSTPACEWHCSFVGGDETTTNTTTTTGETTTDEGVGHSCDSQRWTRRGSAPSGDRRGDDEDVAATPADSLPPGKDVGRESREEAGSSGEASVAKVSVAHQRVSSRAELCPAPQVAYPNSLNSENNRVQKTATQAPSSAIKSQPNVSSQTLIHSQPSPTSQPTVDDPPRADSRPTVICQNPDNSQTPVVNSQHSSVKGWSQSNPPSPRKPATLPTPSRRQPSPQQSPKLPQRQSEPSSPTARHNSCKPHQTPPPTCLQSSTSTPKPSTSSVDPRHQSPLTHWLSELRSSKDAVEDEEGGVSMEEKGGSGERRPAAEEVELRGASRGPCERALNRSRRGSGGEISIYEDACDCLNGEWCCGGPSLSSAGKEGEPLCRVPEASKGGGYKGIWAIDGAALDGGDGVTVRGGLRARGEGIEWRLSALGLKDNSKTGGAEKIKEEDERSVNVVPSAYNRRTISEGMALMNKGKLWREMETKESEPVPKKDAAEEPKTNGVPRKTSTNVSSGNVQNKPPTIEREEGTKAVSPTSLFSKSPINGKPPSRSPDAVSTPLPTRSESHVIRSLPGDEEDWPRRTKFTEDDIPFDDGDGLIILPGTPEGHRSRISQSDSFRSTTSSESKLSSASASSSSQEIPTTGGYCNNNNNNSSSSSGNNSAKSSSCDNVSLSSSGGEVSLQQRPPNVPPRKKPPRKNLKPKEPRGDGDNSGQTATKTIPLVDRGSEAVERGGSSNKATSEAPRKEAKATQEEYRTPGRPRSSPVVVKSKSETSIASGEEVKAVISSAVECVEPPGGDNSLSTEKRPHDKSSRVDGERDFANGKCIASEGVPWEAGKGRNIACPVAPASPRLPTGKPGRDKPSVASSGDGESKVGGARLSERSAEDPSDAEGGGCGSEPRLESPKCGEDDEEEEEEEEEEGFEGDEGTECDWKGVFVSGRRKGSYSSDIEAWKRGLSGWCSVEDEEEFLESTMFDPEDSSMSVGCGSPERSAEEWYSSNDMEGRVYYFEENSNESSWTLPEVSVVSPPQTPPPAEVSGSPAGSDSFISGRSSGGEEGTNGPREMMEREGSGHSIGGGMIGVSRDDMVAMPMVKMKMNQWEKGGRLIQLRDSTLEKELRGGRSSRAAKTRSMVIGDPGLGEIKIPIPGKVPSAKDWPQLWDGNMYVLREGTLNKTKITENKKRVRKNWAPSHVVLTELFLLFFKDAKTFAALKAGSMGGSISPGDAGAMPELCVDLNGALVDREDQLSSRRNVFRVSTVLGLQVLCQDDNAQNADAWFQDISKAARKLPSGFDGSPRLNILEPRNYPEPNSPDEHKKFPRIGRSKSVKVKKDASMEDLSAANVTERQVKIKARLKKFFHRRPTMESLVKKGIWKDEPAFGCYLEQVSGEGIPRIPLFVQKCVAAIEFKPENMKADGLYRASGNLSQVQKIRLQVDQNNLSIVDMEEDVHVLTGALKLFFRELKEPLIPYSLFNRALTASTNPNRKEQLHEFKEIVKILPVANYDTLKFLLQHLLRVTSYQEFNRMHIANLAIVFGPTLMWPKQESLNMALDLMQQNLVIECLLQEFDTVFSSGR